MSNAANLYHWRQPPSNITGHVNTVQSLSCDAATALNWTAALTSAGTCPKGNVWLLLQAVVKDVYVRFGPATSTATTSLNGITIPKDAPGLLFYVSPVNHAFVDAIAQAAGGYLKIQVCSPIGERISI